MVGGTGVQCHGLTLIWPLIFFANATFETYFSYHKDTWNAVTDYCIPDAKRGYYGFIIVVVRVRALVRVRRDFLLATYSPHFFPDFFHIWQVT